MSTLLKKLRHLYKCDTLAELAEALGQSARTMYNWNSGEIPPHTENLLNMVCELKKENVRLREEHGAF
jgi:transcriptional regulator with XRE-family HTH domain